MYSKCTDMCHLCVIQAWGGVGYLLTLPLPLSRFQGKEWIRSNGRGHSTLELLRFQAVPVEAVDASDCAINYQGLDNLCEWGGAGWVEAGKALHFPFQGRLNPPLPTAVSLKELRSLSLQRCPHVDDWCLSRLYQLADSLQELSLAGCPQISERGLACLHHLQ